MPDTDELKRLVSAAADSLEAPAGDLEQVLRGGRRLRVRRRLRTVLVALSIAGLSAIALPSIVGSGSTFTSPVKDGAVGGAQAPVNVATYRVASFILRAAAKAGLVYPSQTHLDYKGLRTSAEAWVATFESFNCSVGSTDDCTPSGTGEVTAQIVDAKLAVTEVTGTVPQEARDQLFAYRESPTPEALGVEFPSVAIGGPGIDEGAMVVRTSPLWTGPISSPPPVKYVPCHVELYDSAGMLVTRGDDVQMYLPTSEEGRAGGLVNFGGFGASPSASRAEVKCGSVGQ